jgi:hypothetical protein
MLRRMSDFVVHANVADPDPEPATLVHSPLINWEERYASNHRKGEDSQRQGRRPAAEPDCVLFPRRTGSRRRGC